jgi:hypothetical protein
MAEQHTEIYCGRFHILAGLENDFTAGEACHLHYTWFNTGSLLHLTIIIFPLFKQVGSH